MDFLLREAAGWRSVHITFFGGETLMNFLLLERIAIYSNEQAAAQRCSVDFSLTTKATLLRSAIIDFLSANRIGVTVSMDGPPVLHDKLRVLVNGQGSYGVIPPKVRKLIQRHRRGRSRHE